MICELIRSAPLLQTVNRIVMARLKKGAAGEAVEKNAQAVRKPARTVPLALNMTLTAALLYTCSLTERGAKSHE